LIVGTCYPEDACQLTKVVDFFTHRQIDHKLGWQTQGDREEFGENHLFTPVIKFNIHHPIKENKKGSHIFWGLSSNEVGVEVGGELSAPSCP